MDFLDAFCVAGVLLDAPSTERTANEAVHRLNCMEFVHFRKINAFCFISLLDDRGGVPEAAGDNIVEIEKSIAETEAEKQWMQSGVEDGDRKRERLRLELENDCGAEQRLKTELESVKENNKRLRDEVVLSS